LVLLPFLPFALDISAWRYDKILGNLLWIAIAPGRRIQMEKVKSAYELSQVAHQAGVYSGFCSMKRLGVFPFPPG